MHGRFVSDDLISPLESGVIADADLYGDDTIAFTMGCIATLCWHSSRGRRGTPRDTSASLLCNVGNLTPPEFAHDTYVVSVLQSQAVTGNDGLLGSRLRLLRGS